MPTGMKRKKDAPVLGISPRLVLQGGSVAVVGAGFPGAPLAFQLDEKPVIPFLLRRGRRTRQGVVPEQGVFEALIMTDGLAKGQHRVSVPGSRSRQKAVAGSFTVLRRPVSEMKEEKGEEPHGLRYLRAKRFFKARFARLGFVPDGLHAMRARQIRSLRAKAPPHHSAYWTPLGAGPASGSSFGSGVSGRALSVAVDPTNSNTVYVGAANGGLWKSTDKGESWTPLTDLQPSLAIGAIAIDPNNHLRIFAGTGECSYSLDFGDDGGSGVLYSSDGGSTWTDLSYGSLSADEVTKILFDPTDPTSQHMFLSSAQQGVFESTNGGSSWNLLMAGSCTDMVLMAEAGPPVTIQLIAGFYGQGLYTSTSTGGVWSSWASVSSAAFPASYGRIALGQSAGTPQTIFAAVSSGSGTDTLAAIAKTIDGGSTWNALPVATLQASGSWATDYNLVMSVHPSNPDIAYYGQPDLFQTVDGGMNWADIGGYSGKIHPDQHALVFDPGDPTGNTIWVCNDGGIYLSSDGGNTWADRNTGLATLQYYDASFHPDWDAIMIGGSQDNGAHFGTGDPAWETINGWDIGYVAMDDNIPPHLFDVIADLSNSMQRSDDLGQTWQTIGSSVSGPGEWLSPFILDPNGGGVCYLGISELWRSGDLGNTWASVASSLNGNITAVTVQPGQPNNVFIGTDTGHVYSVVNSGSWTPSSVTVTDISASPLPTEVFVSGMAVDPTGIVWVCTSSFNTYNFESGTPSATPVFMWNPGTTSWQAMSNGLLSTNPINCIAIDPNNSQHLFCGGDTGVFQTTDGGANWSLWDDLPSLPNSPIIGLKIYNNQPRLLRAATYGRGVWEIPLDAASQSAVDLYMRDSIIDMGRVVPTPAPVQDPLVPSVQDWWWESVDIKVDAQPYQTPNVVTQFDDFENALQDTNPVAGQTNRFYVRIHNRGPSPATNVTVRAFLADATLNLPALPSDFWSGTMPWVGTSSVSTAWTPIGNAQTVPSLLPGQPGILEWDVDLPATTAQHSCLLALATCDEDPLTVNASSPNSYDASYVVPNEKYITQKNLAVVGGLRAIRFIPFLIRSNNPLQDLTDLEFHWGNLPSGSSAFIAFEVAAGRGRSVTLPASSLRKTGAYQVKSKKKLFDERVRYGSGIRRINNRQVYRLSPTKVRTSVISGVRVKTGQSLLAVLRLELPRKPTEKVRFSVVQRSGQRLLGGMTVLVRP